MGVYTVNMFKYSLAHMLLCSVFLSVCYLDKYHENISFLYCLKHTKRTNYIISSLLKNKHANKNTHSRNECNRE